MTVGMTQRHEEAQKWSVVDMQNLYDLFVRYADHAVPSLKKCLVCLCIANPYERLLKMECCKATTFHFSCWFDAPMGRYRTIEEVNHDVASSERIPLSRRCPTCQKEDACAVEDVDHAEIASSLDVACKVCDEVYHASEWFEHWQMCAGMFVDVEAASRGVKSTRTSSSTWDSRCQWLGAKTKQILVFAFVFLAFFVIINSIVHG